MMNKLKSILVAFLNLMMITLSAQTITNVVAMQNGREKIDITFNLQYNGYVYINLYVSEDGGKNFAGPLKSLLSKDGWSSYSGNEMSSGEKKITWEILEDQDLIAGDNIVFRVKAKPFEIFTDKRTNQMYDKILIGKQVWMSENLEYTKKWTGHYKYAWETAIKICPPGWHLPCVDEWKQMLMELGMTKAEADTMENKLYCAQGIGTKLKSTKDWHNRYNGDNGNGNNESGFNAKPDGDINAGDGSSEGSGEKACFWTSTPDGNTNAWSISLDKDFSGCGLWSNNRNWGFTVRCVKD